MFGLRFIVLLHHALVVRLNHVLGDAFHSEDFIFQTGAAWDGILDLGERFLVDLCHVHVQAWLLSAASLGKLLSWRALTTCSIQPPATSVALEVLCLLVIDENLQIIKVALTVVAPRTLKDLVHIGVMPLLLAHLDDQQWCDVKGCAK